MDKFYKVYTQGFDYEVVHGYLKEDQLDLAFKCASSMLMDNQDTVCIDEIKFGFGYDWGYSSSMNEKSILNVFIRSNNGDKSLVITGDLSNKFKVPEKFSHLTIEN